MTFFADADWSSRLCLALLHSLWQLALLAAIARGLECLFGGRAIQRSYAAHVAALCLGVALVPLTFWCGTNFSSAAKVAAAAPRESEPAPMARASEEPLPVAEGGAAGQSPAPARATTIWWPRIAPWVCALYAAGVLLMCGRLFRSAWSAQRLVARARPLSDGPLALQLRGLCRDWSLRVTPALAVAEKIATPHVVGLMRPTILLPAALLTGLSPQELESILTHELAHVGRYDLWVNLLQRLAESALFFNPALWYLSRRISLLREFCCDELACCRPASRDHQPRLRYAAALLHVVELSGRLNTELTALAASGRTPSELRRRVARLLGEPLREPVRLSRGGLLALAGVALLLAGPALWQTAAQSAPQQPSPKQPETKPVPEQSATPGAQQPPAKVKPAPDAENDVEPTAPITVTGRALDRDGRTIAGAEIYLAANSPGYRRLAETKTAADGTYKFEKVPLPYRRSDPLPARHSGSFQVFGVATGHALAWRVPKTFYPGRKRLIDTPDTDFSRPGPDQPKGYGTDEPIELDLTFAAPQSFRGRVVDDEGKPIAKARIDIRSCDRDPDARDVLMPFYPNLDALNERATVPPAVKIRETDADGRFEFTGLPPNYRWGVDVLPPGHPSRRVGVVTREAAQFVARGSPTYGSDFELVFPRPRLVKFRIVQADTGLPAEKVGLGGIVTQAGFWITTDAAGLTQTPLPPGRYKLGISPRYRTPYLKTEVDVEITADSAQDPINLRINPAGVVEFTVVDADTDEPLAGVDVWLDADPTAPKPARGVYGYRSWEVETRISHYESPQTDKLGKMRVNFEPGKHRVGVGLQNLPPGYEPVERDGVLVDCQPGTPVTLFLSLKKRAPPGR